MTLITVAAGSFAVALSGAMMPGPLLTGTISQSVKRGPIAGPLLMTGHAILEAAVVILLLLGLAPLLKQDIFFIAVSFAGAAILAWMGIGMIREVPNLKLNWHAENEKKSGNIIAQGAFLSMANPYWVVWWATIGLGFLAHSQKAGIAGILAFFIGHQLADFGWYSVVSTTIGKGRSFFSDRIYRTVIAVSAAVLLGFAIYFTWSGAIRAFT